jgi:hypothetical protein
LVGLAMVAVVGVAATGLWYTGRARLAVSVAPLPALIGMRTDNLPDQFPADGVFTDPTHGLLLVASCTPNVACTATLWATADGAATWQARTLPRPAEVMNSGYDLLVLEDGTLVFDRPGGYISMPAPGDGRTPSPQDPAPPEFVPAKRWVSSDNGRSWRDVPAPPKGTVAEVPAGAGLLVVPAESYDANPSGSQTMSSTLRADVVFPDGSTSRLATPPPGVDFLARPTFASDGSIWVEGFSMREGPSSQEPSPAMFLVQVSRDRGRSWQKAPLPGGVQSGRFATADGRSLYLVDNQAKAATLYYSHDAGLTWASIDMATARHPGAGGDAFPTTIAALPDGGLIVAHGGVLWRLAKNGTRLVTVSSPGDVLAVIRAGHGVLAIGPQGHVTTDGVTWLELHVE